MTTTKIPKNFNRDACIEFVKTRDLKSLNSLFDWNDTPQGYIHWSCVRGGLKHITDADIIQIQSWVIASFTTDPHSKIWDNFVRLFVFEGAQAQVLADPNNYLGKNTTKVLKFWQFVDGLSDQELADVCKKYWSIPEMDAQAARDHLHSLTWEFGYTQVAVRDAIKNKGRVKPAILWATYELMSGCRYFYVDLFEGFSY
jgi:hypothetical protein